VGILSTQQTCPVLEEAFVARFRECPAETFWR
jgi:hypothetical protein